MLYNRFSEYLKKRYNAKVYKLPVNIPVSCPNRDGRVSSNGCIFCGEEGAGFENLPAALGVKEQIRINAEHIAAKYKPEKYIIYFQNYSNTYLPIEPFKKYIIEACVENAAAIYISTRPDCINEEQLDFLRNIKNTQKIDILIELGLQTVNYKTLKFLNRGHTLAEFIDAVLSINKYGLESCAHYIIDLPMDSMEDVMEGAKILSALKVNQVKCHSLYILKDTVLGEMYVKQQIMPVTLEEYIERTITFLEYLNPEIVIQRLLGRAPEDRTLFCNWGMSWWKIRDLVEAKMIKEERYQGKYFNYLGGII
ncbi:MAG TPA: TIGR01212 family radical SAM protein [Clostridiales bacterium]|nr:TIGR01212 family radical SAM protein [Clostridiales bacterium]